MKNFDLGTKKEVFSIREVGKELLKIEIIGLEYAKNGETDEKVERIVCFYDEIVNNCKKYAEEVLSAKIKGEYDESVSTGEGRRFKKYLYRTECEASEYNGELFVNVRMTLTRVGSVLKEKRVGHVWELKSGLLIPQYNRKKSNKKKGK